MRKKESRVKNLINVSIVVVQNLQLLTGVISKMWKKVGKNIRKNICITENMNFPKRKFFHYSILVSKKMVTN